MALDGDSQTVKLVEPNVLDRPGFSIGQDHGLTNKLKPGLLERAHNRRRAEFHIWHGQPRSNADRPWEFASERRASLDLGAANGCPWHGTGATGAPRLAADHAHVDAACGTAGRIPALYGLHGLGPKNPLSPSEAGLAEVVLTSAAVARS